MTEIKGILKKAHEPIEEDDKHHIDDISHTEDEEDEHEEGDDQEPLPVEYPGTVIPDNHPDKIEHDADLTQDYEDDTQYIDLIHLKITSLEDLNLSRFTQLESICLRQNLIESLSGLKTISSDKIEELDFYDNRINHISSEVNRFTGIKNLDLSFNKIKNIKNIDKLVELENLYFVQNRIKEIKNVLTLTKLKNLELGGNKLEQLGEELTTLVNLQQLWVGKNKISKFENLHTLHNLKILSIQSNRLTKLEGLEDLVNLEELYLSHNGIEKIEGLDKNTQLTVLDVTANKLTKLENLQHLTKLTDFWCSYNQIGSFEEIHQQLGKLPELDTVYFEGNPVQLQNPTAYRRKLKLNLGDSLTKIDATYIRN